MAAVVVDRDLVATSDRERQQLAKIEGLLHQVPTEAPQLLIDGERIEMPRSLLSLLVQVLQSLEAGEQATLIPGHKYFTTQQAAELLGMSRQYLVRLLDKGKIPSTRVGTHRRILAADLMRYKQGCDAASRAALAELTALSEELGLYESTARPLAKWKRLDEFTSPAAGQKKSAASSARAL